MNFNSLPFVILTGLTFLLFYLPVGARHWQALVLLAASLIFYGWDNPYLLFLLLFCGTVTSLASYLIAREPEIWKRRAIAIAGITTMLLVLGFFKYNRLIFQTVVGDLTAISEPSRWLLTLPLPIGISFYTFHGISLVVDTFTRPALIGRIETRSRHFINTSLYLAFFPQLIAGPIMKARDFLPQIAPKRLADVDWEAVTRALIVGYFLKMVVADNLAVLTQLMSGNLSSTPSVTLLALVFAYSCQIFADFAGYSLIAIGLGRLFGYSLMTNFNFPYLAQSFSEFWHRWHISLSTWLRDYLYIPLGGNQRGPVRTSINIMIVMILGGLWHGAAWSYAIWGAVHGLALVLERPFLRTAFYTADSASLRLLRTSLVIILVSFAWLLFRFPDFSQVQTYMAALWANRRVFAGGETLIALVVYSSPVAVYHLAQLVMMKRPEPAPQTWTYAALVAAITLNSGVPGAFIYFQF